MVTYLAGNRIRGTNAERPVVTGVTGGTETTTGSSTIRTFTSTNPETLVVGATMSVQYLVVGGGGSGEQGGGGAGAVRQATGFTLPAGNYTITVGDGAGVGGNIGGDSIFHTITANGGGDGNNNNSYSGNGSGGGGYGGGGGSSTGASGGTYGNDGGDSSINLHGAGGGGAGTAGVDWTGSGGQGGAGTQNLIVGSIIGESSGANYYIGGGGGGAGSGQNSSGGLGGGGDGKDWYPTGGDANTGGGSGGSYNSGQAGGGSGVVIIKYTTGDGESTVDVQDGSIFYETDTNKEYVLYNNTWTEV
jgi:hypothetical protein